LKVYARFIRICDTFNSVTFDYYNLSNGPLEGINNKIKLIKRTSFGYGSYNHLRNRILLCSKLYAPKSKKEVKQCLVA
ncbi:transposase, partial [Staphylococcus aureus]|nr:transposase [Staphylococcus aureus]